MSHARRPSASRRGYDVHWRRARADFLAANPHCVMCRAEGRQTQATVVDHVQPHRGDPALFWDRSNWQGLCDTHHSSTKQAQEKGHTRPLIGTDGWPA